MSNQISDDATWEVSHTILEILNRIPYVPHTQRIHSLYQHQARKMNNPSSGFNAQNKEFALYSAELDVYCFIDGNLISGKALS